MKKILSLFLSVILAFSSFQFCASAIVITDDLPFSYTLKSTKQSYEKGEDIKVTVSAKNITLDEIKNIRIWMDYPVTQYYLTPGVTEHFVTSCTDTFEESFRVCEDPGVLEFANKLNKTEGINNFLLKLANTYKSLTLFYTTVKYNIQNFVLPFSQKTATLGSVKVLYDGTEIEFTLKCRYSVKKSAVNTLTKLSDDKGIASAEIKAVDNSYCGLAFAIENDHNFGLFAINSTLGKAFIYQVENGNYNLVGTKKVNIEKNKSYEMKAYFNDNRVICYVLDNSYDKDPYPVFDINFMSESDGYGVYTQGGGYNNFKVSEYTLTDYVKTYVNPVYENSADPYILKDGSNYYLYATTNPGDGYSVSTSKDLVNWQSLGYCAKKGDIFGTSNFWAPEVYKYNNKYYILYSTDEHLALAVADSPTGPFKKTQDSYLLEDDCIDGHLLFDDDGNIYLYMAYWAETGEEIWGCRMKSDLSGIVPDTLTQLTTCKDDEGGVNEGPFMLKYKGKYYLTYSVNGYTDQNYAVRLAVSDSPLGKYECKGTILEKSGPIVGTGHHSFTTSPDGNELIIAYHCHFSTTQVHSRKLCIDRCKFVETADGYTISVYGPTSTPQPYPTDNID